MSDAIYGGEYDLVKSYQIKLLICMIHSDNGKISLTSTHEWQMEMLHS